VGSSPILKLVNKLNLRINSLTRFRQRGINKNTTGNQQIIFKTELRPNVSGNSPQTSWALILRIRIIHKDDIYLSMYLSLLVCSVDITL